MASYPAAGVQPEGTYELSLIFVCADGEKPPPSIGTHAHTYGRRISCKTSYRAVLDQTRSSGKTFASAGDGWEAEADVLYATLSILSTNQIKDS
jgi:hypothetical protein